MGDSDPFANACRAATIPPDRSEDGLVATDFFLHSNDGQLL